MLSSKNGTPITQAEIQDWQRQRDSKRDDFPVIHLSKQQEQLLRECDLDYIERTEENKSDALALRDLDLISIKKTDSGTKKNVEFYEIRNRGRYYLAYLDGEREKEKRQFSHNWKTTVFSAFAGALLARPLWDGIDWIISAFMEFINHLPAQ